MKQYKYDDVEALQALGIGKLFGPGTPTGEAVTYIRQWAQSRKEVEA